MDQLNASDNDILIGLNEELITAVADDVLSVAEALFQHGVLSEENCDTIATSGDDKSKARELLTIVRSRVSISATSYEKFKKVLSSKSCRFREVLLKLGRLEKEHTGW